MPQINRIRVNNVKYNFGTQVYDDFMMRFNCSNTIYDLANGGGKSLLMLLLLQNMIPNCTLDEKQPIEKLFRAGGGNTVIHSLVEWKLDACYQKDNFKYMTTGFCARKGRNGEDAAQGGEKENAAAQENADTVRVAAQEQDTSSVEYFNYCIFYREFGDNDIKNLPLTSNGERITYNGLKAYLRELEKNDFNVSVKIFDRKGDYLSFISRYGIYESQWEIVRGINKTEGHVRTYFESNYRTSRKVVEDLLIEEIIQKSFNNRLSVDNDEAKMAQTLLDIKDKLLELSKKHAQISCFDSQMTAIEDFAGYVETFQAFYERKQQLEKQLFDLLTACRYAVLDQEGAHQALEKLIEKMQQELAREQKNIQIAEVLSEQKSLKGVEALIGTNEHALAAKDEELAALREKLILLESANDYSDYVQYARALDEINETVNNRLRSHADILNELRAIAHIFRQRMAVRQSGLADQCSFAENEAAQCSAQLSDVLMSQREALAAHAANSSRITFTEQEIRNQEGRLAKLMENTQLMVAENAGAQKAQQQERFADGKTALSKAQQRQKQASENLSKCETKLTELTVRAAVLEEELEKARTKAACQEENAGRIAQFLKIYHAPDAASLKNTMMQVYDKMDRECLRTEQEAEHLRAFIKNAEAGTYICRDPLRDKLKNYLEAHYGEDVVDGHEWFRNLNAGQKRDVLKRTPFVEYGFIIKEDFERIKEDAALSNFERGAYAIPIISEQILYDTKLEVNKDLVAFAMKDMSFLRDDARLSTEIAAASEELEHLETQLLKQKDRKNMVFEDYLFVAAQEAQTFEAEPADVKALAVQLEQNKNARAVLEEERTQYMQACEQAEADIAQQKEQQAQTVQQIELLDRIEDLNAQLTELYAHLKTAKEEEQQAAKTAAEVQAQEAAAKHALEQANIRLAAAREALQKMQTEWETIYAPYDTAEEELAQQQAVQALADKLQDLSQDKLESRFFGLKEILDKETVDVADKEILKKHYRISMEKCKSAIVYRGSSFEAVQAQFEAGTLRASEPVTLMEMKNKMREIEQETAAQRNELNAQNALMNRLEGSIAHGIHQIEEKFGQFEAFECENPERFMKQHKELVKKLTENIRHKQKNLQEMSKALKDIYVVQKDLERIVENAGMTVPVLGAEEENRHRGQMGAAEDIAGYENVSKEYDRHMKLMYRKNDEFNKHKQSLIDLLAGFEAPELAQEIRASVQIPQTIEQTVQLAARLRETNTYIQLEKERIAKGIEDMERIKDNFENRCIQTCSNIKTELDRLPKLSNVTLDGELISMIHMQIPYIKEELYKESMGAYIDETIMMAESFQSSQERLKYIRNRLTWKRLFSVIVTDMNAIRIHLYKRERIKDQSRYLRYEEAVGSTGQSQGIYIQFLIAVINYIASINASSKETALLGKTIFIDNPFGAAKDIYIWEPIFALLKTNHVQLIVPARGATPAITGRFDVNYILGQKLTGNRQQTVVVDYYSKTAQTQMEYTRMDYEQAVLEFV